MSDFNDYFAFKKSIESSAKNSEKTGCSSSVFMVITLVILFIYIFGHV